MPLTVPSRLFRFVVNPCLIQFVFCIHAVHTTKHPSSMVVWRKSIDLNRLPREETGQKYFMQYQTPNDISVRQGCMAQTWYLFSPKHLGIMARKCTSMRNFFRQKIQVEIGHSRERKSLRAFQHPHCLFQRPIHCRCPSPLPIPRERTTQLLQLAP